MQARALLSWTDDQARAQCSWSWPRSDCHEGGDFWQLKGGLVHLCVLCSARCGHRLVWPLPGRALHLELTPTCCLSGPTHPRPRIRSDLPWLPAEAAEPRLLLGPEQQGALTGRPVRRPHVRGPVRTNMNLIHVDLFSCASASCQFALKTRRRTQEGRGGVTFPSPQTIHTLKGLLPPHPQHRAGSPGPGVACRLSIAVSAGLETTQLQSVPTACQEQSWRG